MLVVSLTLRAGLTTTACLVFLWHNAPNQEKLEKNFGCTKSRPPMLGGTARYAENGAACFDQQN